MSAEVPQACPKCGGITGYEGRMTETHSMFGEWGRSAEAGASGINVHWSLVTCCDCGAKFTMGRIDGTPRNKRRDAR